MPYPRALFGDPIRINIPAEFSSEAALLTYLGLGAAELKKIWYYRGQMYRDFSIAKGPNKVRLINAPDERLKFLQRKIGDKLAEIYRPRNPVHGFVAQRSIKTNALAHLGRRFIVNLDLKEFFPSITQNRVKGMLLSLGIDDRVTEIIAQLCCNNRHLPQGAPSSPVLSNMICFRLDKRLLAVAKEAHCIYTRYADDITFSSYRPPSALFDTGLPPAGRISPELLASTLVDAIRGNGFEINRDKAHYADRHSRRIVTGIKINEKPNVNRRYIRNIRAALLSIETLGSKDAENKFHNEHGGKSDLSAHLQGKISHATHIKGRSDPVVRTLIIRFNNCFPSHPIKLEPTPEEIRDRAVWVIDHYELDDLEKQGSAFFLKGVGLVTAAHCVKGVDEVEVFHPSKQANKFKATVKMHDPNFDLAVLAHEIPETEYFELAPISHEIQIGDRVTAVGYPAWAPGDPPNIRPGHITALTTKSAVPLIEVTQMLSPGMSGGPLLDDNDAVTGIIHKGGPGEGRQHAVNIEALWKRLNSPDPI